MNNKQLRPMSRVFTFLFLNVSVLTLGLGNLWAAPPTRPTISLLGVPNINTVAGDGSGGFSGDGAAATAAQLGNPFQVKRGKRHNCRFIQQDINIRAMEYV
jgi:hypothetical protein